MLMWQSGNRFGGMSESGYHMDDERSERRHRRHHRNPALRSGDRIIGEEVIR